MQLDTAFAMSDVSSSSWATSFHQELRHPRPGLAAAAAGSALRCLRPSSGGSRLAIDQAGIGSPCVLKGAERGPVGVQGAARQNPQILAESGRGGQYPAG